MSCCSCRLIFSPNETDLPYILPCKHSACFRCIKKNIKNCELGCLLCENICKLPKITDPENIDSILPINFFLISQLFYKYNFFKKNKFSTALPLPKPIPVMDTKCGQSLIKCVECISSNAILYCKQCNSKFCNKCFKNIHSFHSMKKHSKIPIKHLDYFYEFCPRHPETIAGIFCKSCSCQICSSCLLPSSNSCKDHDIVTDLSTSQECIEFNQNIEINKGKILNILSELDETIRNIQAGQVNLENTSTFITCKNKITDSFSKAHNVLQVAEHNLLQKLSSHWNSYANGSDLMTDYTKKINELKEILNIINVRFEPEYKDMINFKHLQEKIEKVSDFQCQNIIIESQSPKILVDENLLNLMENYCQLICPDLGSVNISPLPKTVNSKIKSEINSEEKNNICEEPINKNVLVTESMEENSSDEKLNQDNNLGEKLSGIPNEVISNIKTMTCKSVEFATNNSEDYTKGNSKTPGQQTNRDKTENYAYKDLKKGTFYNVNVTHVKDPNDFFVQLKNTKSYLNELSKKILDSMTVFTSTDDLNSEEIVGFFDETENYCYRVKIIDENKSDEKLVNVNFIDFGYNNMVSISSLRSITECHKKIPSLAKHCTLSDCKPISGKWESDTILLMKRILKCYNYCQITVKESVEFTYEVNLTVYPTSSQYSPYLMRDALVFLGHAQLRDPNNEIKNMSEKCLKNAYEKIKPNLLSDDEVQIIHVVSPEEFYLRKISHEKSFSELSDQLNNIYKTDKDDGFIPIPRIGYIVACYTENLKWFRGRIVSVINNKSLQILLIDYGGIVTIPSNMIRELPDLFYKVEPMALRCFLFGIKRSKNIWDSEAISILVKVSNSRIPSHVQVITNNSGKVFGIKLYSFVDTKMILINEYLVEMNFAKYILPHKKSKKNTIEKDSNVKENPTLEKSLFLNKIPVKILSTVNPSLIYVSLDSEEKKLSILSDKMQKYYSNNVIKKLDWKNGDKCAILCPETKKWYRGIIKQINDNICQVYFRDTSQVKNIQMDNMREIEDNFSHVEDGAVKCSLKGILPAAGNKWPNLTCEYLHEIVSTVEKFLIEKISEIECEPLSVELWGHCITPGTALEPRTVKWENINELIIEKGLAIRDRTVPPSNNKIDSFCQKTVSEMHSSIVNDLIPQMPENVKRAIKLLTTEITLPISNIKAWKPPLLPTEDFIGIPSFIDNDFNIFIIDTQHNADVLQNINETILKNFENSASQPHDMFWEIGQPCIALYSLDSKYYRAEVLDILENNEVNVKFVDYGNEEICPVSSLRKNLILTDVPIQAHKCKIVGVKPIGNQWKEETINMIHSSIVEKLCHIKVLGTNKDKDIIYIKLDIPSVSDLAHLLVTLNLANYDDYPEIIELFPSTPDECLNNLNNDDPAIIVVSEEKDCVKHNENEDTVYF